MRTASRPALRAPPIATVATGIPAGICTMDSSESRPSRWASGIGTPITGSDRHGGQHARQVRRAARPGDDHLRTPGRPPRRRSGTGASGIRCADTTPQPRTARRTRPAPPPCLDHRPVRVAALTIADHHRLPLIGHLCQSSTSGEVARARARPVAQLVRVAGPRPSRGPILRPGRTPSLAVQVHLDARGIRAAITCESAAEAGPGSPPSTLTIAALAVSAPGDAQRQVEDARRCCSNCEVAAPSMVQ